MAAIKIVYVCSPLRGNIKENIQNANEYCRQVAESGAIPFAPHSYFSNFLQDAVPKERELGMKMGLALLKCCDELLICGGHISEGMTTEIKEAFRLEIPIRHNDKQSRMTSRFGHSQQWLKWAVQCFGVIDNLGTLNKPPIEMTCLHSQKAAQNLLCGCIAADGTQQPSGRDIPELLAQCVEIHPRFSEITDACNFLSDLGGITFPSENTLTVQDMQTALAYSKEIYRFVLDVAPELAIKQPGQEQELSMNMPVMYRMY